MESLMAGTAEIGTLLTQGDFGIGTLEGSNGEIILLDGTLYHANQTGEITILEGEELTPYAAVTRFQEDGAFPVSTETDENIKAQILEKLVLIFLRQLKLAVFLRRCMSVWHLNKKTVSTICRSSTQST